MRLELLIVLTLTAAATFIVVVTSIGLVIHKAANARKLRQRQRLYTHYSERFAEILLSDVPLISPGSRTTTLFKQYESLITPLKRELEQVPGRLRAMHRDMLRQVMVDFAKDLSGETADRLVYFFYSLQFVDEQIMLLHHRNWWVRAQAARDLGLLRTRRALAALTAALEDPHPDVREQAIKAIVTMAGMESLRTIFRFLHTMTTWTAVELSVVVMQRKEQAVPYLIEALDTKDESVVLFCIEMLAEIGFISAVEPLRRLAAEYPNTAIRAKAIEALGRLGDERSEAFLVKIAGGRNPHLRFKSIEALGRMGVPRAVPVLKRRLLDGRLPEKIVAARALAGTGTAGQRVLEQLAASEKGTTRAVCEQVLEESTG